MGSPREEELTTQVSVGGFDSRLSARVLADHLEAIAGRVWRCRLKTSWTPPGSYPDFQAPTAAAAAANEAARDASSSPPPRSGGRRRRDAVPDRAPAAPPHAFVHFAHSGAVRRAAMSSELVVASAAARTACAPRRRHDAEQPFRFTDSRVEVGNLRAPDSFVAAWRCPGDDDGSVPGAELDFVIDPLDGRCRLSFERDAAFVFPGSSSSSGASSCVVQRCDVKLEFSVLDIAELLVFEADDSLLLRLSAAPLLYYRTAADDVHQAVPFDLHDDDNDDPWVRTTDVTPSGAIGRCWHYRISFRTWFWPRMKDALAYLNWQRVPVVVCDGGVRVLTVRDEPEFGRPMQDPFFSVQHKQAEGLGFPEQFLLNALLHKGTVNQHQLTPEFFAMLYREGDDVNVAALVELLGEKFQAFDVCGKLKDAQYRAVKKLKLRLGKVPAGDHHNVEVRRLVITPTRAYCQPPQVERSNRVLRHYYQLADRFLRVTFMDEGMQPMKTNALNLYSASIVQNLMPKGSQQTTAISRRIRTLMTKGFSLCGRKYSFLAYSSNQLKDCSAWFFAEDRATTVASIIQWMGQFPIKNVAKHAARMGLCFTSTYETVKMRPSEVNEFLEDVEYNGYNFSDGIGKITPGLAMEVARRLPLKDKHLPSAYQIRFAGFKGVIALWPRNDDGIRLSLRPSMRKFESTHYVIEVVSWTKFQPAFLNRQIITLLTSLGVPDSIFRQMQDDVVHNLERILTDINVAYEVASSCYTGLGATPGLMLRAGFSPATEPHLRVMLLAIRSSQLLGLLEKTKIFVPKGRWLMGCLDELGILEQGQCFIRASHPQLINNCFAKHGPRFFSVNKHAEVTVGTIVMAKNPCLHPGDVRILEAVDVPELHHLVDCLVLPRKGDRPHANEASGSDLDGDVYFVTWDERLVPPRKLSWKPMDYSPAEAKQLPREVLRHDTIDFFVKNMASESIGLISNAHVVHADISESGAMDKKCIQLAELAAKAVDFPKTGKIVKMPTFLRPKEYPDFMDKDKAISYKSDKIIGKLYRSIQYYITARPLKGFVTNDIPFDTDLQVPGSSSFLTEAWQCKCSYDFQLNTLLNQYSVRTEAEVVTGVIWSLTESNKRKKHEIKERIRHAYSKLHQEFQSIFETIAADGEIYDDDKRNLVYEMKASAWYQVTYNPTLIRLSREMIGSHDEEMPVRLSFAWIAVDHLARIKMRRREQAQFEGRRSSTFFETEFAPSLKRHRRIY